MIHDVFFIGLDETRSELDFQQSVNSAFVESWGVRNPKDEVIIAAADGSQFEFYMSEPI